MVRDRQEPRAHLTTGKPTGRIADTIRNANQPQRTYLPKGYIYRRAVSHRTRETDQHHNWSRPGDPSRPLRRRRGRFPVPLQATKNLRISLPAEGEGVNFVNTLRSQQGGAQDL